MSKLQALASLAMELWQFVAVVAVLLLALRPTGRRVFFSIGIACVVLGFLLRGYGPHHPIGLVPLLGLVVAAAALLAEAIQQIAAALRRRRVGQDLHGG